MRALEDEHSYGARGGTKMHRRSIRSLLLPLFLLLQFLLPILCENMVMGEIVKWQTEMMRWHQDMTTDWNDMMTRSDDMIRWNERDKETVKGNDEMTIRHDDMNLEWHEDTTKR